MNLANKITMIRVLLIPVFVYIMYCTFDNSNYVALAIFALASITDFIDGYVARKYNMITNLGKFLDPLADKVLVISALIMFVEKNILAAWIVIIIIFRELAITGFRAVAASSNIVIAAGNSGKWKTFIQMTMIISLFFDLGKYGIVQTILIYLSLILTIYSGAEIVIKNKKVLTDM